MRSRLLFVAVIMVGLGLAAGGSATAQDFSVGPEVGVNISDFRLNPDLESEGREGLFAGIFVRYGIPGSNIFGIQSGAHFAQKGATVFVGSTPLAFDIDYLELPLTLSADLPLGGDGVVLRLSAGSRVGLELGCDVRSPGSSLAFDCRDPALREEGAEFRTRTTDFGLLGGGGIRVPVAAGEIFMGGRYDIGLTNINDADTASPRIFNNRTLTLAAGYHFLMF